MRQRTKQTKRHFRKTPKVMYSTRKHRQGKQKRKTMSRAQYGANTDIQEISFSIPMRILDGRTNVIIPTTDKLLNVMKANFGRNARKNTAGEIINSDGVAIKLRQVDITGTTITLRVEGVDVDSLEKAEDVIWAVMPAAYSTDIDQRFSFNVDGVFSTKTYYVDILDTPTDISWSDARPILK